MKFGDRSIITKWDSELGPVEFRIGKMDGSTNFKWENIKNGHWKIGTVYINENIDQEDGGIYLTVSYRAPKKEASLDPEKTMTVSFGDTPEMFVNCSGQKSFEGDVVSVFEAINGLGSLSMVAAKYELCKSSAGNPRRVWGSKKMYSGVQKRIARLTARRSGYVQDRNHFWTRRITNNAERWGCGNVVVVNVPSEELFGHPWQWFHFSQCLSYKLDEIGAKVRFVKAVPAAIHAPVIEKEEVLVT